MCTRKFKPIKHTVRFINTKIASTFTQFSFLFFFFLGHCVYFNRIQQCAVFIRPRKSGSKRTDPQHSQHGWHTTELGLFSNHQSHLRRVLHKTAMKNRNFKQLCTNQSCPQSCLPLIFLHAFNYQCFITAWHRQPSSDRPFLKDKFQSFVLKSTYLSQAPVFIAVLHNIQLTISVNKPLWKKLKESANISNFEREDQKRQIRGIESNANHNWNEDSNNFANSKKFYSVSTSTSVNLLARTKFQYGLLQLVKHNKFHRALPDDIVFFCPSRMKMKLDASYSFFRRINVVPSCSNHYGYLLIVLHQNRIPFRLYLIICATIQGKQNIQ